MRQARAIFLGGELLDASEVKDYSEYYSKGFICPFCLEKVFYQQEFTRQVSDKTVPISSMFKHHKGDPLGCEARAKTSEGKKLLELLSGESRKQRKQVWDKYLWELFASGFYTAYKEIMSPPLDQLFKELLSTPLDSPLTRAVTNKLLSDDIIIWEKLICSFYEYYQANSIQGFREFLPKEELIKISIDDWDNISSIKNRLLIHTAGKNKPSQIKTNTLLHQSICFDVVCHLVLPSSRLVFRRIIGCFCLISFFILGSFHVKKHSLASEQLNDWILAYNSKLPKVKINSFMANSFYEPLFMVVSAIDWHSLTKHPMALKLPHYFPR